MLVLYLCYYKVINGDQNLFDHMKEESRHGLLCSYNRLVNDKCSLQSFEDANGDRFDFYRFFRLMEQEDIPDKFKKAQALLYENYGGADKDALLSDVVTLIQSGRCTPSVKGLLGQFGYM